MGSPSVDALVCMRLASLGQHLSLLWSLEGFHTDQGLVLSLLVWKLNYISLPGAALTLVY